MSEKTYVLEGEEPPASQIGASLEALAAAIAARRDAGDESYTHRLLTGDVDALLKKVMEEAGEVALAAKDAESAARTVAAHAGVEGVPPAYAESLRTRADAACDHVRYEAADVVYHLLVVLECYGIGIDELAGELNARMTEEERPCGGARIVADHVKRGK